MKNEYQHNDDGTTDIFVETKRGRWEGEHKIIIDTEDWNAVNKNSWHILCPKRNNYPYARAMITLPDAPWIKRKDHPSFRQKQTGLQLHHLIMGKPSSGMVIDHINGNGLDNRKCNLRFVTPSQNQQNRHTSKS
tara:strand:+ start:1093 stop:1494 length:402 start_codon:yes stop_codon:yes gene_type:complete